MYKVRGVTLLELIIVLAIGTILVTIALPSFQTLIKSNRISSVASSIKGDLLFARNQAVSYLNYVTVCPLENNSCGSNWKNGLDIFIDSDRSATYDDGEVLLKAGSAFDSSDTLVFPSDSLTFTPDGLITGNSAMFRYCSGDDRVGISINYSGRTTKTDNDSFSDCD